LRAPEFALILLVSDVNEGFQRTVFRVVKVHHEHTIPGLANPYDPAPGKNGQIHKIVGSNFPIQKLENDYFIKYHCWGIIDRPRIDTMY
jgi:hypothetical protein